MLFLTHSVSISHRHWLFVLKLRKYIRFMSMTRSKYEKKISHTWTKWEKALIPSICFVLFWFDCRLFNVICQLNQFIIFVRNSYLTLIISRTSRITTKSLLWRAMRVIDMPPENVSLLLFKQNKKEMKKERKKPHTHILQSKTIIMGSFSKNKLYW